MHSTTYKHGNYTKSMQIKLFTELEAQGPCTGHRSIIAILYCFFKYNIHEKRKGKRSDSVHKFMWIKHFAPLT